MKDSIEILYNGIDRAHDSFIECVMRDIDCTKSEAEKVFKLYRREKILKLDAILGQFTVTHGEFLMPDVLQRAVDLDL